MRAPLFSFSAMTVTFPAFAPQPATPSGTIIAQP